MKLSGINPKIYIWTAILISLLSLGLFYIINISSSNTGEAESLSIQEAADQPSISPDLEVGFDGFFSINNPIAWFMFGAWFALLLFFIVSLFSQHSRS